MHKSRSSFLKEKFFQKPPAKYRDMQNTSDTTTLPKDGASSPSTGSCKTQLASNDREDKANKDTQTPVLFEGVFKCRLAHTAESQQ